MMVRSVIVLCGLLSVIGAASLASAGAPDPNSPETVIRELVHANVEKDMPTMSRLMAHDADITSYSIGGRKYVGWQEFEREMREEFANVQKFEIPIRELTVWHKGDVAWFTMELDYTRYTKEGGELKRMMLPLRETGVLERRNGQWVMLSFHESFRSAQMTGPVAQQSAASAGTHLVSNPPSAAVPDLSGEWDILEVEDDKRYKATLDKNGNGPYSQHGGRFTTTKFEDRLWQGTWQQPGNDREGGFEVLLSEDGTEAKGIWWYTRVQGHKNIPPKEHGGTYHWKRTSRAPSASK
ncbi:MAG: SnoaL-like domain-containing protein [Nitrospira sp.]|jgi:ketosteroid isomerase-like protein|nr:SnoaL-like domain-containing protein [Nitrospira sp.]